MDRYAAYIPTYGASAMVISIQNFNCTPSSISHYIFTISYSIPLNHHFSYIELPWKITSNSPFSMPKIRKSHGTPPKAPPESLPRLFLRQLPRLWRRLRQRPAAVPQRCLGSGEAWEALTQVTRGHFCEPDRSFDRKVGTCLQHLGLCRSISNETEKIKG